MEIIIYYFTISYCGERMLPDGLSLCVVGNSSWNGLFCAKCHQHFLRSTYLHSNMSLNHTINIFWSYPDTNPIVQLMLYNYLVSIIPPLLIMKPPNQNCINRLIKPQLVTNTQWHLHNLCHFVIIPIRQFPHIHCTFSDCWADKE